MELGLKLLFNVGVPRSYPILTTRGERLIPGLCRRATFTMRFVDALYLCMHLPMLLYWYSSLRQPQAGVHEHQKEKKIPNVPD